MRTASSLSPTKLLITGEGGVVSTNDDVLAETIRVGREYGNTGNYDSLFAGMNARMPEFNALLGLRGLDMLEDAARTRNETAALYQEGWAACPGSASSRSARATGSRTKIFRSRWIRPVWPDP